MPKDEFRDRLPAVPSLADQTSRRREHYERFIRDGSSVELALDQAHASMVDRDQTLHDIVRSVQANGVGHVEFWVRQWNLLDDQIAERTAFARELSGQAAEQESER